MSIIVRASKPKEVKEPVRVKNFSGDPYAIYLVKETLGVGVNDLKVP